MIERVVSKILHLTEHAWETQLTQKWVEGQAHGVEIAARRFKKMAAQFFQEGQDAKARQFRDELPHLLEALKKELTAAADQHQRDYVEGQPPMLESDGLVKAVLAKAAKEVMDEDSWPRDRCNLDRDMQVIADNIEALAVDPEDLLKVEPP